MRRLTMTENRILHALQKQPDQTLPIETIAQETRLTVKRVYVRGRELTHLSLVRLIMHRVYAGPHSTTSYFLKLEPAGPDETKMDVLS
jgi:hypothetical protein